MNRLGREQKIALARIITDLIEADFVVEPDEMRFFEQLISPQAYSITDAMLVEAKKMDFAKAVGLLRELDAEGRAQVVDTLRQLALSDGTCVPLEAILVLAVEQVLTHGARLFSIPGIGVDIDNLCVIYVENQDGTDTDAQIRRHHAAITGLLAQSGFHFVHIPGIVGDFAQMQPDYLLKVVRYMMPSISETRALSICHNLTTLTTSRFCRDQLYRKLGINLIDCAPSFLVKINESDILAHHDSDDAQRIRFANYLQIETGPDALATVSTLLHTYSTLVNAPIATQPQPLRGKFLYHGFHRSLFDLIAYGRQMREYRLVFEFHDHKAHVCFQPTDGTHESIALKLNPQETALYYLIVHTSLTDGGLDWREHIPQADRQPLLDLYNHLYTYIGKANHATAYKDRTQVHHIKNRIRAMHFIANVDMFVPQLCKIGTDTRYRILATPEFVNIGTIPTL